MELSRSAAGAITYRWLAFLCNSVRIDRVRGIGDPHWIDPCDRGAQIPAGTTGSVTWRVVCDVISFIS